MTAHPDTPVRGPGSGRRTRSRVPRSIQCPPARWPGGAHDPAGQAWRLQEQHSLLAGDPLDVERARRAITAARAVYAAYHHLSLVLGVDGIPGPGYIRAQAAAAAVRGIYGPEPIHAPARDAVYTAMHRAGLLP